MTQHQHDSKPCSYGEQCSVWINRKPDYLALANERFAWPGGYEMFFVTDDSGVLCAPCVVTEWKDSISVSDPGDGWHIVAVDHDGAIDDYVTCDHCNRIVGDDGSET